MIKTEWLSDRKVRVTGVDARQTQVSMTMEWQTPEGAAHRFPHFLEQFTEELSREHPELYMKLHSFGRHVVAVTLLRRWSPWRPHVLRRDRETKLAWGPLRLLLHRRP